MSGHSKWANIKRKKEKVDAQRGKVFTKLSWDIITAARKDGDIEKNSQLKTVVQKAKEANMPNDNIERAIKRGTGELEGINYEEINYEGYGPGGAAILLEILTENRNRTASEIRHCFNKHGGNMGEAGCVTWMFDKQGIIFVEQISGFDEEDMMLAALDAGAEDLKVEDEVFEIICKAEDLELVESELRKNDIPIVEAQVTMIPQNTIKLEGENAEKMNKLIDVLESHNDVQEVYTNYETED
ncbi:MAG: YebC/PmpR family DNA-binding transcriptional regulator [Clostridiales bacterium]|nr:YebC/PmpR family DNA-binding transcriptional regulator [Clostridiales bacterium]MCF8022108.1 YebC/PmpR family DNA-binding transcriptional regulator [Clostridiales bacterium]